jgi:hypothetical protein
VQVIERGALGDQWAFRIELHPSEASQARVRKADDIGGKYAYHLAYTESEDIKPWVYERVIAAVWHNANTKSEYKRARSLYA